MGKYIKKFDTHSDYEDFIETEDFIKPNVSYCVNDVEVHYNQLLHDYSKDYFTIEALESGTFNLFYDGTGNSHSGEGSSYYRTPSLSYVEYSIDNGETWVRLDFVLDEYVQSTPITLQQGDKVLIRGINEGIAYYYWGNYYKALGFDFIDGEYQPVRFNVYGNIMSLLYGSNFSEQTTVTFNEANFALLFYGSAIVNAEHLILPLESLSEYCYYQMFKNCDNLILTPKLSAMTLGDSCYYGMFENCTSLESAPELPATTLAQSCYSRMFQGCTNLINAPELSATTLISNCYSVMFKNCANLNYIKAMFTTEPGVGYTYEWVSGVSATGTFVKNSAAAWNVSGTEGIPSGWTIETASE